MADGESGMADGGEPGDEPLAEEPKYDQAFFLDLALQGKEKWNKWRDTHKGVHVTFAGIDFSERFVNAPLLAALVFKSAGGGS